jgi:hypothetical protein
VWDRLADVKTRVHTAQRRAALAVNAEVGQRERDILDQQGRRAGARRSPTAYPAI